MDGGPEEWSEGGDGKFSPNLGKVNRSICLCLGGGQAHINIYVRLLGE